MSYIGTSPNQDIVVNTHEYVAVAGQTVFNVVYDKYVEVYINGILLSDTDYVASNGVSVVLNTGASAGDVVKVSGYDSFRYANTVDIDTAQTITGQKTFTSPVKVADATLVNEALSKGQLLAEMKAVDGAGSGLDADLLDGLNSSSFALVSNVVHKSFIAQYYQALSSANGDTEVGGAGVFTLQITTKRPNSRIKIYARHFGEQINAMNVVFNVKRNGARINTGGDNSLWRGLSMPCQTYPAADNTSTPEIMELTTIDTPNVTAGTTLTYMLVMARSDTPVLGTYTNRTFNNTGAVNYETGTSELIIEEML